MKKKNQVYTGWEAIFTEKEKQSDSYDSWVREAALRLLKSETGNKREKKK